MIDSREVVDGVLKVFPDAMCGGYNVVDGFCIYLSRIDGTPVVCSGRSPWKAWTRASKLIKNKKALAKFIGTLPEQAWDGRYGFELLITPGRKPLVVER